MGLKQVALLMKYRKKAIHRLKVLPVYLLALLIFQYSTMIHADESVKMNIHVKGHVVASGGCTFDTQKPPDIDFGTVRYSTLGGNTLRDTSPQLLTSAMSCTGDYAGQTTMQLIPTKTGETDYQGVTLMQVMDDDTGTVSKDLGIRLLVNDIAQNINEAFKIDMKAQPVLKVELVQIGNGDGFVNGAGFSAAATLTMTFL